MRNIFGLIIVLLGLGFLLQQFNPIWAPNIMNYWWPMLIIAVGLLAWNGNRRTWFGPMLIVLVGMALLLDQMSFFKHSAWNYFWPVVIILLGSRILFGKPWDSSQKTDVGSGDATAVFSGVDRKVTGPFQKSEVSAWFGGVKLDCRDAQFAKDSVLNVSAGFGGVEIWLPKDVRVVTKVTPVLGGVEDKTNPDSSAAKTLTITGMVMFGGATVKN